MRRILSPVLALLLVTAGIAGAVAYGPEEVREFSPVEEVEAVLPAAIGVAAVAYMACNEVSELGNICGDPPDEDALTKADALETKTALYSSGSTAAQSSQNLDVAMNNYLQDTRSIARMEGKNAYIKALNNGTSEAAARTAARGAIEDYYSGRQMSVKANFETSAITIGRMVDVARNTSGIDMNVSYVYNYIDSDYHYGDNGQFVAPRWESTPPGTNDGSSVNGAEVEGTNNISVSLVNGSSVEVTGLYIEAINGGNNLPWPYENLSTSMDADASYMGTTVGPQTGNLSLSGPSGGAVTGTVYAVQTQAPSGSYNNQTTLSFEPYAEQWSAIETQNQAVQGNVDEFVNSTYDAYQQGEINSSDLVDPYLSARDYSPTGESSVWALRTLTSMGMSPPDSLDTFREMTIGYQGSNESGVLLSDGLPQNNQFDVGTVYNTSNLTGEQIMLDTDTGTTLELAENEEFEVLSATNTNGEAVQNITYRTIDYNASSTDEYAALQRELANTSAEIEALQANLRDSGPGFGIGGGGASLIGGIIVVGGAVWLLTRD